MSNFTLLQQRKALYFLVLFHLLVIISSNYLVQIPFEFLGLHTTWGALSFPFIFLATDLTVRIFGASLARRIIFWVMLPALVISYVVSVLFFQGAFAGFSELAHFNTFVGRIALASFAAYLFGQFLDIQVFNRLRQLRQWWIAPVCSTIFGCLIDSIIFFSIAFYKSSDSFMAANWVEIGAVDYGVKLLFSLGIFVPIYGVLLSYLVKKITQINPGFKLSEVGQPVTYKKLIRH